MRLPIAALLALLPCAAFAQTPSAASSVADCERIQNALAYNECLASFGPKVGERRPRITASGAEYQGRAVRRPGRGSRTVVRGRGGRQSAVFEIRRGRAAAQKARPARAKAAPRRRRR